MGAIAHPRPVLGPAAARDRLRQIRGAGPLYPSFLRALGTMLLSFAFAIDILGTWQACLVALATGAIARVVLPDGTRLGFINCPADPFLASHVQNAC